MESDYGLKLDYGLKDYIDMSYETVPYVELANELQSRIRGDSKARLGGDDYRILFTHLNYYFDKLDTLSDKNIRRLTAKRNTSSAAGSASGSSAGRNLSATRELVKSYRYIKPYEVAPVAVPARMTKPQFESFNPYAAPILHKVPRESDKEYRERIEAEKAYLESLKRHGGRRRTNRRKARRGTKSRRA